jgi:uncharacterized protein (TIGR02145 family)
MKRIFTILAAVLFPLTIWAQSPQKMSYQAVIRNSSGQLVTNHAVGMRISILQGSSSGTVVYTETQTPTTNANGLVSIEIGGGAGFDAINWANYTFFIKTETDPTGGTTYTITGTSQLLSVPYALYAAKVANLSGTNTGDETNVTIKTKLGITTLSGSNTGDQDLSGKVDKVTGKDLAPNGTTAGQMLYWNGSAWINVAPGTTGQVLTFISGVPTWKPTEGKTDVQNPTTGKIWMDRNLGATQVATSSTDAASYGYLYQWGRGSDGHQMRTSATTTTLSGTNTPGHGNFILTTGSPNDWRSPQNTNLWQGVDGVNNPCPSGYRIPTESEWDQELVSWSSKNAAGAFGSPLKLSMAGYHRNSDGSLIDVGSGGGYWSSTVDGAGSRFLFFYSNEAYIYFNPRAWGYSVRCIKD